jgi:hypothetical protein
MTAEGLAAEADGADVLHCYRHPERETYISCGRCDRPICTACAMLGPVGARCRECGKLAFDPMTSFTPAQLVGGSLVAVSGGLVGGFIGLQVGFFFALCLGPLAGGFLAEAVMRVTGFKRGPLMRGVVIGGMALGAVAALLYQLSSLTGGVTGLPIDLFLSVYAPGMLVWLIAAAIGASWRLR